MKKRLRKKMRHVWLISPVTRVKESKKKYDRVKEKEELKKQIKKGAER